MIVQNVNLKKNFEKENVSNIFGERFQSEPFIFIKVFVQILPVSKSFP